MLQFGQVIFQSRVLRGKTFLASFSSQPPAASLPRAKRHSLFSQQQFEKALLVCEFIGTENNSQKGSNCDFKTTTKTANLKLFQLRHKFSFG